MITKRPGRNGKVLVTFALPSAFWADTIFLVGDFNSWNERATSLRQTEAGWMVTLELEAGRSYQYRYLLNDSEWHNDWNADGYASNPLGGDNSVVFTPNFACEAPAEIGEERIVGFPQPRLYLVTAS